MRMRAGIEVLMAGIMSAASAAFAARPLTIDDANPQDFKTFKIEGGGLYENGSGYKHWDFPLGTAVGIFPSLGIGAGFGGQFEEQTEIDEKSGKKRTSSESGIEDLTLGVKWQFLKETPWLPRQTILPAVKFPTADKDQGLGSGKTDYDLTWIASKSLCEKMGAHVNIGYSFIGKSANEDVGDILHYGIAFDYRIVDPLQWVGEVYTDKELRSGTDTVVMFNTGFRYSILERLIADIAAGSRIAGDAPDLTATAGLTWTFGFAQEEKQ